MALYGSTISSLGLAQIEGVVTSWLLSVIRYAPERKEERWGAGLRCALIRLSAAGEMGAGYKAGRFTCFQASRHQSVALLPAHRV